MNFKLLFALLFSSVFSFGQSAITSLEEPTNDFFQKYVKNGLVDYQSLQDERSDLDQLVQLYAMSQFKGAEGDDLKAFYINAYNLMVIKGLVDKFPVISPQNIPAFFTSKNHVILGDALSLNEIEKKRLNPKADPRLHFVLVCGAKGCPPMADFAYQSDQLNEQMNAQTKVALNNPNFIRYDKENQQLSISQIFEWYMQDFAGKDLGVIDYINEFRDEPINDNTKYYYYTYDWSINSLTPIGKTASNDESQMEEMSNLQLFTPSALFSWGQWEVNSFNTLYFQNSVRDSKGNERELAQSQAFYTNLIQITSGIPKTNRLNVGIDINMVTARYGPNDESPLDYFNDETTTFRKTILSSIGPRIKYVPLKKVPRLSIQSTFLIPIAEDQERPLFIFHDRYTWFTQIFFDQNIRDHFQIFLEADLLYRFDRYEESNRSDFFRVPLSGFFSYFPTSKSTLYVFSQYSPRYENVINMESTEFGLSQWFTQIGIGAKYQFTDRLGGELSYADFAWSANAGAGYVVNVGLRYIYR